MLALQVESNEYKLYLLVHRKWNGVLLGKVEKVVSSDKPYSKMLVHTYSQLCPTLK